MTETLQIINLILSISTSFFAVLVIISKPFRNFLLGVKKQKKEESERDEILTETARCLLRDSMTKMYYKHHIECELNEYEYQNMSKLYEQYKKLGGNSFIDKIWEEVQDWRIL